MNLLDVENLSVARSGRPILHDVSLTLRPGEIVALLGPNGSGKTTLVAALVGHLRGAGVIRWNGKPIERIDRRTRASLVALLPQTSTVPEGMRVRQFLTLGRTAHLGWFGLESADDAAIVEAVAAELNLIGLIDRRVETLSGGQRQRVLIGRALAQQPRALLLDEPDTFLDLKQRQVLGESLRRLARVRGIGALMASHDVNFAAGVADRFVLLTNGRSLSLDRLTVTELSEAFDVSLTERMLIAPFLSRDL